MSRFDGRVSGLLDFGMTLWIVTAPFLIAWQLIKLLALGFFAIYLWVSDRPRRKALKAQEDAEFERWKRGKGVS